MKLMCRMFGHRVNRKRVRRVGHVYVSRCKWCRTGLERGEHRWHEFASPAEMTSDVAQRPR